MDYNAVMVHAGSTPVARTYKNPLTKRMYWSRDSFVFQQFQQILFKFDEILGQWAPASATTFCASGEALNGSPTVTLFQNFVVGDWGAPSHKVVTILLESDQLL